MSWDSKPAALSGMSFEALAFARAAQDEGGGWRRLVEAWCASNRSSFATTLMRILVADVRLARTL